MQGKKQGIDVWPAEFDAAQKNNSFLNLREMFFPYGLMSFRRGLIFPRSFIFSLTHQAGSKNPISARSNSSRPHAPTPVIAANPPDFNAEKGYIFLSCLFPGPFFLKIDYLFLT